MARTIRGLAKVLRLCKQLNLALAKYSENIQGATPLENAEAVAEAMNQLKFYTSDLRSFDFDDDIDNPVPPSA